jgi:hypothetical protein
MLVQVPSVPARLQAWQVLPQALLQQRPSTQLPLMQYEESEQVRPFASPHVTLSDGPLPLSLEPNTLLD